MLDEKTIRNRLNEKMAEEQTVAQALGEVDSQKGFNELQRRAYRELSERLTFIRGQIAILEYVLQEPTPAEDATPYSIDYHLARGGSEPD